MHDSFFLKFNNKKIYTILARPDNNKKLPAILFLHGATNEGGLANYSQLIEGFKKKFVFLIFNFLGCGKSEGDLEELTLQSRLDQAIFMFDYLMNLSQLDNKNISVIGGSMGGHVGAILTGKRNFKNLILRAPASYRKDYENIKMKPHWLPWDRENKYWPWEPSSAFEAIEKYKGNLLIVKHEKDEIIPNVIINEYFNRAKNAKNKKLMVLKNAPHKTSDLPSLNEQFIKIVEDFILQT